MSFVINAVFYTSQLAKYQKMQDMTMDFAFQAVILDSSQEAGNSKEYHPL